MLITYFVSAQTSEKNDKIYKHNGEVLQVKVIKVGEYVLEFKYPSEDVEQTIGKLSVDKIEYSSGRIEKISDKVIINGIDDWEKVQIVTYGTIILGLRKGEEIRGKTSGWISYNTQAGADKKWKADDGTTLRDLAIDHGYPDLLPLLEFRDVASENLKAAAKAKPKANVNARVDEANKKPESAKR